MRNHQIGIATQNTLSLLFALTHEGKTTTFKTCTAGSSKSFFSVLNQMNNVSIV